MKHFLTDIKCGDKGKCKGTPKQIPGVKSHNDCLKLCSDGELLKDCIWVSFNLPIITCWLYDTKSLE